jgi:20S proteasome alpha/beta subunit
MTIGIGVPCEHSNCIVLAADTRGSYADPTVVPHEYTGKQFELPLGLYGSISGDIPCCTSLISSLYTEVEKLAKRPAVYHDHVRNAIREAQLQEVEFRFDYALMNNVGMRLSQYRQAVERDPGGRLRRTARAIFRKNQLDAHFFVAGFLETSPVLLSVVGNYEPEIVTDFIVVGSGETYARAVLDSRGQRPALSFQRTVLHVAEAMHAAKGDDYVGEPADYIILEKGKMRRLPALEKWLVDLREDYKGKDSEPLDSDSALRSFLIAQLYEDQSMQYSGRELV